MESIYDLKATWSHACDAKEVGGRFRDVRIRPAARRALPEFTGHLPTSRAGRPASSVWLASSCACLPAVALPPRILQQLEPAGYAHQLMTCC